MAFVVKKGGMLQCCIVGFRQTKSALSLKKLPWILSSTSSSHTTQRRPPGKWLVFASSWELEFWNTILPRCLRLPRHAGFGNLSDKGLTLRAAWRSPEDNCAAWSPAGKGRRFGGAENSSLWWEQKLHVRVAAAPGESLFSGRCFKSPSVTRGKIKKSPLGAFFIQNQRTTEVGRDSQRSPAQPPSKADAQRGQVAQSFFQAGSESLPATSFSAYSCTLGNIFPGKWSELALLQILTVVSHPLPVRFWREPGSWALVHPVYLVIPFPLFPLLTHAVRAILAFALFLWVQSLSTVSIFFQRKKKNKELPLST